MAKKVSLTQYRQMVNNYNAQVKRHNDAVTRQINDYNRKVQA